MEAYLLKHIAVVLLSALAYASPAIAAPERRDTLAASVIVSDVRMESLESNRAVPVTKIFMKRLEREQAVTYKDLSASVPNLFIPDYGSKMTSSIYVRGLGARIDNPVMGMYVDGVGYLNKNNYDTDLFDIRSVEVFRGPQGTMFGRNTIGGVISIRTLSPFDWQGTRASAGYGNGNTASARVSHYAAVSPRLGVGAAGYWRHTDGFYRNSYVDDNPQWAQEHGSGAWADEALCDWSDQAGGRLRLEWRPSGMLTLDNALSADWVRQGGFPYAPSDGGEVCYNDYCGYRRLNVSDGLSVRARTGDFVVSGVTALQYSEDRMDMDQDYMPVSYFTLVQSQREYSVSQEVALRPAAGDGGGGWDWLSGASVFYRHNAMSAPVTFLRDGIEELILEGANSGISTAFPGEEIMIRQESFVIGSDFLTQTAGAALYHTSFFTVGNWKFEAGLRLDLEYAAFRYASAASIDYLFTMTMDSYRTLDTRLDGRDRQVFFQVLPRVSVTRKGDWWSAYASVSKGYKAGGFNTQLFSDILQNRMMEDMMSDLGVSFDDNGFGAYDVSDVITYKPERCWNFELGADGVVQAGGGTLSAGVSLFLIETFDQQLTVFPSEGTGRMMTNAGRSRSLGAELNASWHCGPLAVDAAYGHTDARFVRYDNGREDFSGKYVPYIPSNTLSVSATYGLRLGSSFLYGVDFNANVKGFGRIMWDEANTVSQPFYALLGASVRLLFRGWSLELWGKNLTGTRYDTFYFVSMGNSFLQRGRPVQYGLSLNLEIR